jgi:acetyl-CoA C-acetyltransferase
MNGQLSTLSAIELGSHAIRAALANAQLDPTRVDQVIGGQVIQVGAGQNPARQAAIAAGIPLGVPAITLNSVCLSGAEAVTYAARMIELGEAEVVVAFGQESMSQAPHILKGSRLGKKYGAMELVDSLEVDGLTDAFTKESMGLLTEKATAKLGIDRESQDRYAVLSHQRATTHMSSVVREIAPIEISIRGKAEWVSQDDGIRPDVDFESVSKVRSAFAENGSITAANASQLTDGAAALVIVSERFAKQENRSGLAEILSHAKVSGPDYSLNLQPSNAIFAAVKKAGIEVSDLSQIEVNEAFAAVVLASGKALNVDIEKLNPEGGAIALGHPIGASGARLIGHLALKLHGTTNLGAMGICGGGGQGVATILKGTRA